MGFTPIRFPDNLPLCSFPGCVWEKKPKQTTQQQTPKQQKGVWLISSHVNNSGTVFCECREQGVEGMCCAGEVTSVSKFG